MDWPDDEVVYVVEDDSRIVFDTASTLVRVSGDDIEVLRKGPVPESEIRRIASLTGYLEVADRT